MWCWHSSKHTQQQGSVGIDHTIHVERDATPHDRSSVMAVAAEFATVAGVAAAGVAVAYLLYA
jgi:predicted TIM-barrel fold metal-dependent hydrolase